MKISPTKRALLAGLALFLASVACTFSLAEDITPPPGSELSLRVIEEEAIDFPAVAIDLQRGAEIYTQSCAPCHGETGLGDGPQSTGLPFEVPAIGTSNFAAEPSLSDWYLQITNGNLDKFMPPFAGSYSVQERWDVLAYVIGLPSISPEVQQELAVVNFPAGFSDVESVAGLSGSELIELLAGSGALNEFSVDEAGQAALVQYAKSLALGIANGPDLIAQEVPSEAEEIIEEPSVSAEETDSAESEEVVAGVSGRIVNGSGGGVPAELEVAVRITSNLDTAELARGPVDENGNFTIVDFVAEEETVYFFAVDVQGLTFFSNFYTKEQLDAGEPIEIEFFESARDVSGLTVEVINLVFDFAQDGSVQVIEQVIISNSGEYAAAPGSDGDPLLFFELPENSSNLVFEQGALGDRYFFQENGFGDIRAVLPGANTYQMLFGYQLPYEGDLEFELVLPFETANVAVYLPENSVRADETVFNYHGKQLVQNQNFDAYFYSGGLEEQERISIRLDGIHPLEESAWLRLVNNDSFVIGLLSLAASVGLGWWWYRSLESGQGAGRKRKTKNAILDEIVELDKDYEAGDISQNRYENRREKLKEELAKSAGRKKNK